MLTLGSLFDGIGGFPLAATQLGIRPVWASEIEPAPVSITKRHFPDMEHLGDITKINGAEIEPVDIITFGSPCQDLSVAGKQAGMKHEEAGDDETTRSGLFVEAVRIVREMREATNGAYPTYIVWENVPGAFSSNGGRDFGRVLTEITETYIPMPASGKWASAGMVRSPKVTVGWRVLDAQYWGVPQRRKRIFLIGDFGNGSAAEILFEQESLLGYSPQGRAQGQGIAADAQGGAGAAGFGETGVGYWQTGIQTLRAEGENRPSRPSNVVVARPINTQIITRHNALGKGTGFGLGGESDPAFTLQAGHEHGVFVTAVFCGKASPSARNIGFEPELSPTLRAGQESHVLCVGFNGYKSASADITYGEELSPTLESSMPSNVAVLPFDTTQVTSLQNGSNPKYGDPCHPLAAGMHAPAIAIDCRNHCANPEISGTLQAKENGGQSLNYINPVMVGGYYQKRFGEYEVGCGTLTCSTGQTGNTSETLVAPTLDANYNAKYGSDQFVKQWGDFMAQNAVRRLTPTECARLQGFPDGWAELGVYDMPISPQKLKRDLEKGALRTGRTEQELLQTISDSAQYKAYGNSLAIPCAKRVLLAIKIAQERCMHHEPQ